MSEAGVVSFDLDGTLWEFEPMMEGALRALLAEFDRRRPALAGRLTLEALHEHRHVVGLESPGTLEELRRASIRRALGALEVRDDVLAEALAERLLAARAECVELHADVEPAIEALLARGYRVGAITNGNFPCERLPAARSFAFIVHAEQTGALKPAAEPFAEAVRRSGGSPGRWVHVGDDPRIDVVGAQDFGMRAVWLNRIGAPRPDGVRPDAELASLERLPETVERLLAGRRARGR